MDRAISQIAARAMASEPPARAELLDLAARSAERPHDLLYWAGEVRRGRFGRAVRLCCIVPGKLGACGEDCKWCAQSARSASGFTALHRASRDEILSAASAASACGAANIGIVNSGRRPSDQEADQVAQFAADIRAATGAAIGVCASLGELTDAQARRLARAGIVRYHHNLETSRRFFPQVVTTHDYQRRMETLASARGAGMSVCCGGLFGMGETWEDRVDLALALRDEVRPDVVPLNFLHPVAGTALQDAAPLEPMEILRIIAIFRLALPSADIKVAGGRQVNLRDLQSWVFLAGATSLMTGDYLTTQGRQPQDDLRMIADLGMEVVKEF